MTFAIFIVLVLGLFIALLNILPSVESLGIPIGSSIATLISYARAWDFIFPIHETITLVGIVIAFEVSVWIWHVSWKIVKMIRGHSDGA